MNSRNIVSFFDFDHIYTAKDLLQLPLPEEVKYYRWGERIMYLTLLGTIGCEIRGGDFDIFECNITRCVGKLTEITKDAAIATFERADALASICDRMNDLLVRSKMFAQHIITPTLFDLCHLTCLHYATYRENLCIYPSIVTKISPLLHCNSDILPHANGKTCDSKYIDVHTLMQTTRWNIEADKDTKRYTVVLGKEMTTKILRQKCMRLPIVIWDMIGEFLVYDAIFCDNYLGNITCVANNNWKTYARKK